MLHVVIMVLLLFPSQKVSTAAEQWATIWYSRQQQLRFLTFAVVKQLEPGSHEYPINYVGHTLHTFAFHGR